MELEITSESKSPHELRDFLETHLDWDDSYGTLRIRVPTRNMPSDPAVVVAIVGAAGTALGALIAGLLQIAQQYPTREMKLRSKKYEIVLPADTPDEKIDRLIQKLHKMDDEVQRILLP